MLRFFGVSPTYSDKSCGNRHCSIGFGEAIISKLRPFSLFEKSIKNYFEVSQASALVGPLLLSALPQLRLDLERLSKVPCRDVFQAYAEITKRTMRPIVVASSMPASDYHTLFTGQNLRWETLGLILIIAGSNAQFTSPNDPIFTLEDGNKLAKDEFIEDMIHASNNCITLCQVHGAVNDVMVWLMYHNMLVTSNFYGDNCTWPRES